MAVVPPEEKSPAPPIIPDYELLRLIGRGSYGDVWLGRGATGLYRAVKVVWRNRFEDVEPYEREFRGLSDFMRRTEGVNRQMALLHVGRNNDAGWFYYVMELADDAITGNEIDPDCYAPMTLRIRRDQSEHVPADEVLAFGIELAAGLANLHATGLVHRDIKPSNIIIVNGRPKLADIGQVSEARETMSVVGTEGFIPPEGPGTPAADIFSLGKVLYELAMGEDRQNFPTLPGDLDQRKDRAELLELNEVIVKACAPLAEHRHPDALALLEELKLLQAGKSVRRLRFAERGLSRARRWGLLALGIAVIAGVGAAIERNRADREAAGRAAAEAELAELTRRTLYDASLAAAQRALETENFGVAREALERSIPQTGDPDLRGFEWYALWREAQGDPAEIIRESGDTVTRLEASPGGRWMAVDNTSPVIDLFDQQTGEFVKSLEGIHRVAGFTADGSRLVGTTPTYEIETWSTADGSPDGVPNKPGINRPLEVHPDLPHILFFEDSPDSEPHILGIWNYETGDTERIWMIDQHDGDDRWVYHQASASRDLSKVLLLTSARLGSAMRHRLQLIDLDAGKLVASRDSNRASNPLVLSSDASRFVVTDPTIRAGFSPDLSEIIHSTELRSVGHRMEVHPNDNHLIVPVYGNKIAELDMADLGHLRLLSGSRSQVAVVSYDARGEFIWSADRAGEVRRWSRAIDMSPTSSAEFVAPGKSDIFQLSLNTDSQMMAVLRSTGAMQVWDFPSLSPRWHRNDIRETIDSDTKSVWVLSVENKILELDVHTGRTIRQLAADSRIPPVHNATPSPSGEFWLIEPKQGDFILWDVTAEKIESRVPRSRLGLENQQLMAYVLCDDGLVLSMDTMQRLVLWQARTGEIVRQRTNLARAVRIELSPDQKLVSITGGYESSQIVSLANLETLREFPGTRSNGIDMAFHPFEPIVATQTLRGSVSLIDYRTGRSTTPLNLRFERDTPVSGHVSHLQFSSDGKALVAVDIEGRVKVWRRD